MSFPSQVLSRLQNVLCFFFASDSQHLQIFFLLWLMILLNCLLRELEIATKKSIYFLGERDWNISTWWHRLEAFRIRIHWKVLHLYRLLQIWIEIHYFSNHFFCKTMECINVPDVRLVQKRVLWFLRIFDLLSFTYFLLRISWEETFCSTSYCYGLELFRCLMDLWGIWICWQLGYPFLNLNVITAALQNPIHLASILSADKC